jgi:Fibronectin type III domain
MKLRSPVMIFAGAAALALVLLGCTLPVPVASRPASSTNTVVSRAVLPGTSTPAAALVLSQSAAFSILGHSCGGIQEKAYATGFDPVSGLPTGDVYVQTRCGGSGRGGGYHTTTYSAWVGVTWDFTGTVVSSATLAAAPTVDTAFTATDAYGDSLDNISAAAYLVVPVPSAPTDVAVVQSGDQFQVSWTPNGANPLAFVSSTLTATPVDSTAPTLTISVTGSAATGLIGPLQPQTTYQVTVVSSTVGGSGPASTPIEAMTAAASIPPSAPTGVTAQWAVADPAGDTDTLVVRWMASVPGDSPVDQYQVTITGSDGAGTLTQTVDGATLTTFFAVSVTPDWSVTLRAHNSVGWGPWSTPVRRGGL